MTGRTFTRRTGLILVYCLVFILIVITMIEVKDTLEVTIRDLQNNRNILLACALTIALVPSAAILFWIGKAIATNFCPPVARVCRYFRTHA
jgi:succinate dehydrogenase hydrophobic anchor subunit